MNKKQFFLALFGSALIGYFISIPYSLFLSAILGVFISKRFR